MYIYNVMLSWFLIEVKITEDYARLNEKSPFIQES